MMATTKVYSHRGVLGGGYLRDCAVHVPRIRCGKRPFPRVFWAVPHQYARHDRYARCARLGENAVNFSNQINLTTAAVALIVGIADYTWTFGELSFAGIALGTAATLIIFHLMTFVARSARAAAGDPLEPST